MALSHRAPGRRRLASLILAAAAISALLVPAGARASASVDEATLSSLESAMVALLNADRTSRGLVPVRVDSRLMAIARARSDDMVANGYFSHTQPDGRNVFDILTAQHITWYNAGEIIAWNNYPIEATASAANNQWMNSAGHKAIIISTDLNYVGVGLAVDPATGKKTWTAVFIKGPDRTPGWSSLAQPTITTGTTSTNRKVSLKWSGSDIKLQVLTAGLKSFTVQRRADGGSWTTVWSGSTSTAGTMTLPTGHRWELRVSAIDKRGNVSTWSTKVVDLRCLTASGRPSCLALRTLPGG
jgi:uncharacterized protein YkwD